MNHPELLLLPLAALWCGIGYFCAYVGGWAALGRQYKYRGCFVGSRWPGQTVSLRAGIRYRNCVTLGASNAGFFMAMPFLFRMGCPNLLVPWEEAVVVVTGGQMQPALQLHCARVPSVILRLRGDAVMRMSWVVPDHIQLPSGY